MDFQVQKVAVSILKSDFLLRENTQWGTARLAVEGEVVPASKDLSLVKFILLYM